MSSVAQTAQEFVAGSWLHGATVLVCLAAMIGAVLLGRRWRDSHPLRERSLRIGWVFVIVATQTALVVWWVAEDRFEMSVSLPLHMCDLAVVAAPFALLMRVRWLRTIVYFWGIGLSTQAFIQPALTRPPSELIFWLFWLTHTEIVGTAVYLAAVMRYRPTWRDLCVVLVATASYFAAVTPVNIWLKVDYGYIGPREGPAAWLGPWPARIFILFGLEVAAFVILWLPWAIVRAVARKHHFGSRVGAPSSSSGGINGDNRSIRG